MGKIDPSVGRHSDKAAKTERQDIPDQQAARGNQQDRNQADRRLHEEQQRTLLGGARRESQERDMGDIDPDI